MNKPWNTHHWLHACVVPISIFRPNIDNAHRVPRIAQSHNIPIVRSLTATIPYKDKENLATTPSIIIMYLRYPPSPSHHLKQPISFYPTHTLHLPLTFAIDTPTLSGLHDAYDISTKLFESTSRALRTEASSADRPGYRYILPRGCEDHPELLLLLKFEHVVCFEFELLRGVWLFSLVLEPL